jgi:hypothetical protein
MPAAYRRAVQLERTARRQSSIEAEKETDDGAHVVMCLSVAEQRPLLSDALSSDTVECGERHGLGQSR